MKKLFAALAVLLLVSCSKGDSPTAPTLIDANNQGVASSSSAGDPAPSATTTTAASAKVWAHGKVDVTGPWEGFVCYFWLGPHEQDKAHPDVNVSVPAGETVSIDWPGIKADSSPEHCTVQIDVGTSCAKSSIIPGMLAHGYVAIKECNDCIEDPVVTVREECSEWTECPTGDVAPEECYRSRECATITTTDYKCQDDTTTIADRIEKEACVCKTSCVEEGPYTSEVWFPEILKGKCPNPSASCREQCHQLGEITTSWDCKDPSKDPLCRPVDCPEPEGMCFYEIKGSREANEGELCSNAGGIWDRWGPADKIQCRIPLPGILDHDFRLTPGQSHPDCLKFTGPSFLLN